MQESILFTKNLKEATALYTMGVPAHPERAFSVVEDADNKNQRTVTFFFKDTPDGLGKRIMQIWQKGWSAITNPEDPLAYIRAALENRERILDAMNNATPLVKKSFGKATLLISKNATPELKKKLSRYL